MDLTIEKNIERKNKEDYLFPWFLLFWNLWQYVQQTYFNV
jgi:hypothetical protein